MTDGIGSSEGKRRGCAFRNLSNEFVPPYACMMIVAPPDNRVQYTPSDLSWKSSGVKGFGFEVDNEYGLYVDKCDAWGMLMQDPNRFVFNGDTSVPPGGTGYCSFGEYPVRAVLQPGMTPYTTNRWDSCYYAAIEGLWNVYATGGSGAFKFFGKVQDRSLMVWLVPNHVRKDFYAIWGTFTSSGIAIAPLIVADQIDSRFSDYFYEKLFDYPKNGLSFTTFITLKAPGVYVFQYRGTADVLDPDPSDTTIPYELSVENDAISPSEDKGDGILKKVSDGYSSYWPSQRFDGVFRVVVESSPVRIRLKQTLTAKVETEGNWRLVYDKEATRRTLGFESTGHLDYPWWIWGSDGS